ncbi:alpha/beta hydrolase family protein [Paraglaciecola sp.]|uniref:alpha/beta hydrolase family protein n=1 Tax=Paraglaciecola sp. TaxID=1920173 RepID=UPI003EF25618
MQKITIYLVLLLLSTACGNSKSDVSNNSTNNPPTSTPLISKPTEAELSSVKAAWASRDLAPTETEIILEDERENHTVYIIQHLLDGNLHYGAVFVPKSSSPETLPILVMPDGLDQRDASLNLDNFIGWNTIESSPIKDFIQIYPGFRGRTLRYEGRAYYSTGDFCDAYDGTTDDTMSFLTAALQMNLGGNTSKILAVGISRGGNTVFQLGIRDPRISTIISMAAPVDFNREEVRSRYGSQYVCQFITGKSTQESRQFIVASSPIYFPPRDNIDKYFIFQGGADPVVPQWNAQDMSEYLISQNQDVTLHIYPNADHGSFWGLEEHDQNYRQALSYFIQSLE